ncbi:metallophosphoesterase family protein [Rhizobium sp. C4]|uniref:metallophosphoesterase family protein n=1 Tax=Rhizobium sp. C4 TaxID=1349800 RepID=UPI001E2CA593|nr:metallophosphoesterase [Rhizobium sp. C4]MCD2173604.1 metallophosphoesterase [Rhizobium sp. C4]
MRRETTFIHLTDLHIGTPDDDHLYSDTTETLLQVLDLVDTVTPKPQFFIASGDLTNRGDAASFRRLKEILEARIHVPVIYALGNHDTRPGFYEGMGIAVEDQNAPYDHDTVIGDIHIITLDSSTPGLIGGTIDPEQFDWLEAALDRHPDLPKLIVVHHPPALGEEADVTHWRTIHFPQSERLRDMLKGRNIIGILSGHIHHDRVSVWHGIPVVVGTGQHAATDILRTDILRMVRGASFGIGTIRPSGLTMAFVPLPSDRAELNTYPLELLLARAMPVAAE